MPSNSDKVLVVVSYYGGYGGNFFADILRKSITQNQQDIVSVNDKNEYAFQTDVLGSERNAIDAIMKAYDKGFETLFDVHFYEKIENKKYKWGDTLKKIFIDVYDNDRSVFCSNLTAYLKKRLRLKDGFNVINAHYSKNYGGFSIHDISDKVIFFLLSAEDHRHCVLFDMLLDIKHNHFIYPEFIKRFLMNLKDVPDKVKPFDSCHLVEVGKLFLQTKDNGIDEVERVLSEGLGVKISLDKRLIEDYSKSNIKLLNEFLSIDVEEANYKDVLRATEKKLKSLL